MTELAAHCSFLAPTPIGLGHPGGTYPMPWSVQTWIPGTVATPWGLADSLSFADDLIELIHAMRSADTGGRTFSGAGRGGYLPDHDGWMEHCFHKSEGMLDVETLRVLWAQLSVLPAAGDDIMSHGDLTPANLLVNGEHLVGVLDGGGFSPADPALDLVAAWHLLDSRARNILRKGLECSDVEWHRGAAWALQQAMGLLWYYERTNPGMAALGRSTLRRILDDPDMCAA